MQVQKCERCQGMSVPFFGFAAPCPISRSGGHGHIEPVEVDEGTVARRLAVVYSTASPSDRLKFDQSATKEQKALLAKGWRPT